MLDIIRNAIAKGAHSPAADQATHVDCSATPVEAEPLPAPAIPDTLDGINARLEAIADERRDVERLLSQAEMARNFAASDVREYTELAKVGKLRDPQRLVYALAKQAKLDAELHEDLHAKLTSLDREEAALHAGIMDARKRAVQDRYNKALAEYVRACREPVRLARELSLAAEAAGHVMSGDSRKATWRSLLGDELVLAGTVINPFNSVWDAPVEGGNAEGAANE